MARKRTTTNKSLPARFRMKGKVYYYIPRERERFAFDNKWEFPLGRVYADALTEWARRMTAVEKVGNVRNYSELVDDYIQYELPLKKAQSREDIPRYLKILRDVLGEVALPDITTPMVYQLYKHLQQTFKGQLNTCNKIMSTLSDTLSYAIRESKGGLLAHPMTGGKFTRKHPKAKADVLTLDTVMKSLECAPPKLKAYVLLKLITAARRTDMLQWTPDQYQPGYGLTLDASKTGKSDIIRDSDELARVWKMAMACHRGEPGETDLAGRPLPLFCTDKRVNRGHREAYINYDNPKEANGWNSIWRRWHAKAVELGLIESGYQERTLRNLASDLHEADDDAKKLLQHSGNTTKRVYRTVLSPNSGVLDLLKPKDQHND